MAEPTRTPYAHKIRYGITGAPILTEDEMDGSHAPGVGLKPVLIQLVYSAARDGKPATVDASVTGNWTRFGEPADGQVTTHFKNGPEGWPAWLAAEARLHDPDAAPADSVALRDRIAEALRYWVHPTDRRTAADAVLAVLSAPVDRAAVLTEAANALQRLEEIITYGSRDWGSHRSDAWLYGVLVGWDCERDHEHDQACENGLAMLNLAARHNWGESTVARLRRSRAAVNSLRRMAVEAQPTACAECGHPELTRSEGEDPVSPGRCTTCPEDGNEWHDYQTAAAAQPTQPRQDETPRQPVAYSGKGRTFCVACPRPNGEDIPLTINDVYPWDLCPSCGRHVVDVARAAAEAQQDGPQS
ncbi:hypothetical protein [Streptomyces sp. NPDC007991]|uniref:hypothetical protein n=1 Tax=Streptomyces sp. NPDC007991 TaxID=3364803 RepID=UPI0036F14DF7